MLKSFNIYLHKIFFLLIFFLHFILYIYTHTHTHTPHTHTHNMLVVMVLRGTFHRRNGFYTVQTVCAIALHLPYT